MMPMPFILSITLLAASCATPRAAAVAILQNTQTVAPAVQRPANALAYEHYLKSTMLDSIGELHPAIDEMRRALAHDDDSAFLHYNLGRLFARDGHWDLAAEEAGKANALDPNAPDTLLLLGDCLYKLGKIDQALAMYQTLTEKAKDRIDAYIRIAEVNLERGDWPKAIQSLEAMTNANPTSAEGFRRLGDLQFEHGDERKAEVSYRRALDIDPSDTITIHTLAGLLEQQGRYQEALRVFTEALDASPENPQYMATMARLYLKDGDTKSANAYIEQLRSSDPANAGYIAQSYAEINRYPEAIHELEVSLAQNPELVNERLMLAILLEGQKQCPQALEQLKLIPLNEGRYYINAQIHIGSCLKQLNRLDDAMAVLRAALDLTPQPDEMVRIHRLISEIYIRRQQFQQALDTLESAIHTQPDQPDLLEAKANVLIEMGRGEEGITLYKQALAKHPKNVELLYALGALYERIGKIPDSLSVMRQIIDVDPNNAAALNFIGYLLADRGDSLDEAERLIRRALLLNPGNGAITDSLGWLLYKKGRYQQALEFLQRADRTTPGEPVIIMHVGDALMKLGQRDQAITHYRRALQSDPEPRDRAEIIKRFEELGLKP